MHVHHVLFCNVLVEAVDDHDGEEDSCSSGECAEEVCACCEKADGHAAEDGEGENVAFEEVFDDALVSSESWDLQARAHDLFCLALRVHA